MDPEVRHFPELIAYRVDHVVLSDPFVPYTVDTDELAIGNRIWLYYEIEQIENKR